MLDEFAQFVGIAVPDNVDDPLFARLARQAVGAAAFQPGAGFAEFHQRRSAGDRQIDAKRSWQSAARDKRLAQLAIGRETLEQSAQRLAAEHGAGVSNQRERRQTLAAVGDRPDRPFAEPGPSRNGDLLAGTAVANGLCELGIVQQRRMQEHGTRDFGAIAGERHDDMARRIGGAGQRFGERAAHGDRGIIERRRHREQRFGADAGRQSRPQVRPGQRIDGPDTGVGRLLAHPDKQATHNAEIGAVSCRRSESYGVQRCAHMVSYNYA